MGKLMYRGLGVLFAIPASIAMKKVLNAAWQSSQGGNPPTDPKAPDAEFSDVLAWAGLSALSLAAGRYVASRGAAVTYRALTGRHAPGWAPEQRAKKKR